jgi:hypothetical protein
MAPVFGRKAGVDTSEARDRSEAEKLRKLAVRFSELVMIVRGAADSWCGILVVELTYIVGGTMQPFKHFTDVIEICYRLSSSPTAHVYCL